MVRVSEIKSCLLATGKLMETIAGYIYLNT
jgi:hypothetical protein